MGLNQGGTAKRKLSPLNGAGAFSILKGKGVVAWNPIWVN